MRRRYAANTASNAAAAPVSPCRRAAIHAVSSSAAGTAVQRTTAARVTQEIPVTFDREPRCPCMLEFFRAGGVTMIPLTVLGIAMLVIAIKFARNADPQRLSLLRALTIAIAFLTIVGVAAGLASTAHFVVEHEDALKAPLPYLLQGFAETMTNVILGG